MSMPTSIHPDTITQQQTSIRLSLSAADAIAQLIAEENNPHLKLRIYVTGGGCSGFKYGFNFDETISEDDFIFEQITSNGQSKITYLIDAMSYAYLKNATIDYEEDINGKQFIVDNPNAKTTCGCGSSFSLEE